MGQDKRNTFLIMSGDKNRVQMYMEVLSRKFPNTSIFNSSEWFEAKYKLDNVMPKIVLVDEYLPQESGIDVVKKILKDRGYKHISIIIMSPVADHDQFTEEVAQGRVQFLTDPDREPALVQCVSRIVAPQKEESENQKQYELRQLKTGEFLFKEGDVTEVAYIVKKGTLRAFSECPDGERIMLGEITAGEFVGEMGHFTDDARSATVQAATDVELIAIPNNMLDQVIFNRPSWAKALVKTLSHRLKRANRALVG